MDEPDYVREGWDKRGARSRLDRRSTDQGSGQAPRRSRQDPVPFTNEDLRFRQLVKRATPATNAAVIFALDVSGSMDEARAPARQARSSSSRCRASAGSTARSRRCSSRTPARRGNSTKASSSRPPSSGGTVTSCVARLALDKVQQRFDPAATTPISSTPPTARTPPRTASRPAALLAELAQSVNYAGYVETGGVATFRPRETQLAELFNELKARGAAASA